MESDISNSDIHVGTLDVSRDEFSVSPIHEEAFTPFSTATVESIHNPNATNSTNVKSNLSYHFSKYDIIMGRWTLAIDLDILD